MKKLHERLEGIKNDKLENSINMSKSSKILRSETSPEKYNNYMETTSPPVEEEEVEDELEPKYKLNEDPNLKHIKVMQNKRETGTMK
jgi:hypothetical protein